MRSPTYLDDEPLSVVAAGVDGVGEGTVQNLNEMGFKTAGDVRSASLSELTDAKDINPSQAVPLLIAVGEIEQGLEP